MTSNSHPPSVHDDPDYIPRFLCHICNPAFGYTPEKMRELEAVDRARLAAEAKERQRQRDIDKCNRAIVSATRRGEPAPGSVADRILAGQRKKLARLMEEA